MHSGITFLTNNLTINEDSQITANKLSGIKFSVMKYVRNVTALLSTGVEPNQGSQSLSAL